MGSRPDLLGGLDCQKLHSFRVKLGEGSKLVHYGEARSLARAGYDVEVIGAPLAPESALGIEGIRLTLIPQEAGRFRRALIGAARLGRMLFKRRPDVIHLHDPELLWLGLVLRLACCPSLR